MKRQLLLTALAGTLTSVAAFIPTAAMAQDDDSGWYIRGNAGAGGTTDSDFTGDLQGDVESEYNGAGSLGLGYDFGNSWRVEADALSLWNDLGAIGQVQNTAADFRQTALMLNAIYDFNDFGRFEPYVGAGVGLVQTKLSAQAHDFPSADPFGPGTGAVNVTNPACSPICDFNDKDQNFAWQVLAGLGYDLTDNLTWDTQYRYFNAGESTFEGERFDLGGINPTAITTDFDTASHVVMTGLRYRFGQATAPVMYTCWDGAKMKSVSDCAPRPVKAPEPVLYTCENGTQVLDASTCPPAITYISCPDGSQVQSGTSCPIAAPVTPMVSCPDGSMVSDAAFCAPVVTSSLCAQEYRQEIIYYEFNKPRSAETQATIDRILDVSQSCSVGSILVVGHTDTSGAAAYNLNLSKKRAKDARDELVRDGVNPAIITSEGRGETEPFVDSGDGVKEPLNRRTEVLIRLNSN